MKLSATRFAPPVLQGSHLSTQSTQVFEATHFKRDGLTLRFGTRQEKKASDIPVLNFETFPPGKYRNLVFSRIQLVERLLDTGNVEQASAGYKDLVDNVIRLEHYGKYRIPLSIRPDALKGKDLENLYLPYSFVTPKDTTAKISLAGRNLTNANFEGADLTGFDFTDAVIPHLRVDKRTNIGNAKGIYIEMNTHYPLVAVNHKSTVMFKAGCFYGTYGEAKERLESRHRSTSELEAYEKAIKEALKTLRPKLRHRLWLR